MSGWKGGGVRMHVNEELKFLLWGGGSGSKIAEYKIQRRAITQKASYDF